jgi:hypothetical protein
MSLRSYSTYILAKSGVHKSIADYTGEDCLGIHQAQGQSGLQGHFYRRPAHSLPVLVVNDNLALHQTAAFLL